MKLTKISLAALVALGAFSSVASATPLEEAIKNVDFSGMARYRYTNVNSDKPNNTNANDASHAFKFIGNFKAAIDDNFFGVVGFRYNKADASGSKERGLTDKTNTNADGNFGIHQFYLGYTYGGTTVTAGKQVLGTFFTDDAIATGLKIVNKDVEGLTLAALAFDAIEYDNGTESDGELYARLRSGLQPFDVGNLYSVAAMGSYDPISFQLWYASLENLTDLIALDLEGNFAITDDISIGARGQFVNSNANSDAKGNLAFSREYNDGNFYAGELSTELFGARLAAGYIGWKVDDKGVTSFSLEDQGGLIDVGEQRTDELLDYTYIAGKGSFWFARAGYTFDKFDFDVDYINGNVKRNIGKTDYQEVMPKITYNYSKKLVFSTFYSWANYESTNRDEDTTKYRFEAKYSF